MKKNATISGAPNWPGLQVSFASPAWRLCGIVLASVLIVNVLLLATALLWGKRPSVLLLDPNYLGKQPAHFGLISSLGSVVWFASGASAVLAWAASASNRPPAGQILLLGGSFTLMLALDDLLMLHDGMLRPFGAGTQERAFFAVYGVAGALFFLRAMPHLSSTDWPLLVTGAAALAGSVLVDVVFTERVLVTWLSEFAIDAVETQIMLEESLLKLSGIAFWSLYFFRLSFAILRRPSALDAG